VTAVALIAAATAVIVLRAQGPLLQLPDPHVVTPKDLLRVCADPNNLPFSNDRREGFENALAELVGRDLHRTVQYAWWPQRRGFVRQTLRAGTCDVIMGVPSSFELAQTTRPYYRSTYVFVTRRRDRLHLQSFDDPRLKRLRIGLHVIGDDYNNVPPAQALAARGIVGNIAGYSIYGDYRLPDPPRTLIDAVARGDVDVAIAWGPLAGYFARRESVPLELTPVNPQIDLPFLPMVFDIAMAVRRGDTELRDQLESVISRRKAAIHALLVRYGVPLLDGPPRLTTTSAMAH